MILLSTLSLEWSFIRMMTLNYKCSSVTSTGCWLLTAGAAPLSDTGVLAPDCRCPLVPHRGAGSWLPMPPCPTQGCWLLTADAPLSHTGVLAPDCRCPLVPRMGAGSWLPMPPCPTQGCWLLTADAPLSHTGVLTLDCQCPLDPHRRVLAPHCWCSPFDP